MTEPEALQLLNKLENFMKTTNETLRDLVIRTENFKISISNLENRIKKIEKNNGSLIITRR